MLTISLIDKINPFEWDKFTCPVCGKNHFISLGHASVWCEYCNAKFEVRDTAGDPGCVVDCFIDKAKTGAIVYAPKHACSECEGAMGLFDWQDKTCPHNLNHGAMQAVDSVYSSWKKPEGYPEYFYLILKLGDYCSGWLAGGNTKAPRKERLGPTQDDWNKFQEEMASKAS